MNKIKALNADIRALVDTLKPALRKLVSQIPFELNLFKKYGFLVKFK